MRNSYSTFINLTKKIFWVISAILIYLIFNSQNLEIYSDNKNFSYDNSQSNDQVIRGAKFFSSDNKNRPFTLTATSAQKKTKSDNMYNLIFPSGNLIVAIEAAVEMGWEKWLHSGHRKNKNNCFIGMKGFGASAPAKELYDYFGINAQGIINTVKSNI